MNAGKSTTLLQSAYNYRERGMDAFLLLPEIDTRFGRNQITSRIGLNADATTFSTQANLLDVVKEALAKAPNTRCVLLDEAQFLTKTQVLQLSDVPDYLGIPVLCYGLRVDFQGELFEGSQYLMALAEELIEIKTICHCGSKATMVLRLDEQQRPIKEGAQLLIGGNEAYIPTCRKHYKEGDIGTKLRESHSRNQEKDHA